MHRWHVRANTNLRVCCRISCWRVLPANPAQEQRGRQPAPGHPTAHSPRGGDPGVLGETLSHLR
jgi:hypothetical protein